MKSPFIQLSPEITRENALTIMEWLKNADVTRYLSDSRNVSRDIERVVTRVHLPTLTHLFNQGGRFFMVHDGRDAPVGFVRLVRTGADYEMVMVIGERSNWGRKLGTSALRQSLKTAFLELRARKLIARIHPENLRSIRAFRNCGFQLETETAALLTFTLTQDRYLALPRDAIAPATDICITAIDKVRLERLLAAARTREDMDERTLRNLEFEIDRAAVIPSRQVSRDVVTMNTRARLLLNDEPAEIALVYPEHADNRRMVSVFSPVGTAILGFREGDLIDWRKPEGNLKIHIEKVLYQPEAAGDFHL